MITAQTLCQWIDLAWVPIALLTTEKGKKIKTAFFAAACVLLLRFQVELLQQLGFADGALHMMTMPILQRGMVTYACFVLFFLIIAHFSRGGDKHVHLAASITIMIAAFCVSTVVMVL